MQKNKDVKEVKKIEVDETILEVLLHKIDRLEKHLTRLDTADQFTDIKKELKSITANAKITATTMQAHGNLIESLKKTVEQIRIRCPLLKLETDEFSKIS